MPCCTNSKTHNTDDSPHNSYSDQQSVSPTCCTVALTVSPTVQTTHHTIAIVTNSQSAYLLPCCTNSKPHITDVIPHNCYSDQQSVCTTCCSFALTKIPAIQTAHRTLNIYRCEQNRRCFHVNTETETTLETFYLDIRTLNIKRSELFDNVCYTDFHIMFEILLNDI